MPNPIFALFIYVALGLFIVKFGRQVYFHPNSTLRRWYSYLPEKEWARKLIRGLSVFWVFGGLLMILSGVVSLPLLSKFKGISLIAVVLGITCAGTALLLRRHSREPEERAHNLMQQRKLREK
jgi:hypothetical protein